MDEKTKQHGRHRTHNERGLQTQAAKRARRRLTDRDDPAWQERLQDGIELLSDDDVEDAKDG